MEASEVITVTDEDRKAAAAFFRDERTPLSVKFTLGFDASPLLEAFAAHRIAAYEKAAGELERLDGFGEWYEAAAAIRALKEKNDECP